MKICLLVLLFASNSFASSGKILFFRGSVLKNGHKITSKINIKAGDKISVQKKSIAIISLDNLDKIKLSENTEVVIEAINKPVKSKNNLTKIFLKSGSVFSKVSSRNGKSRNFKLRTKSASMGVRGTEFFTAYGRKNIGAGNDQWMCVKEGSVEVSNSNQKVLVKEGEGIFITKGVDVTKPKPYAWTRNLNWNMNPKNGKLENNIDFDGVYTDFEDQDYD